jgi:hypothetical protein
VSANSSPGTDVMIFKKYFCQKNSAKKLAFLSQKKPNFEKR